MVGLSDTERIGERWCYEGWLTVMSRRRGMARQEGRGDDAGDQGGKG